MDASCCPILVNDRAGALHNTPTPRQLQELAQEVGLNAEVIATKSAEDMQRTLRQLVSEESPKVAVVGGDGTVALVGSTPATIVAEPGASPCRMVVACQR